MVLCFANNKCRVNYEVTISPESKVLSLKSEKRKIDWGLTTKDSTLAFIKYGQKQSGPVCRKMVWVFSHHS